MIKCGFVAIIGKANAGKSSLINRIVNEKVSIVSPKPQTTRNNILGIYNAEDCQIIFVDTPGINKTGSGLDNFMQKSIKGAVTDVNVVILASDITKPLTEQERNLIDNYYNQKIPVILVLTKIDLVPEQKVFEVLSNYSNLTNKCELVPLSSLKNRNVNSLLDLVKKYLPKTSQENRYYDEDLYTDKSLKFIVSEIIREKALYYLDKEIPHGIAVDIWNFNEETTLATIEANIICEKDSHKVIILGKGGEMLKKIGHSARVSIQKILQKKVVLNLFIKVKPNWKNNLEFLDSLGYNINEI